MTLTMKALIARASLLLSVLLASFGAVTPLTAQPPPKPGGPAPFVSAPVTPAVSQAVRLLPAAAPWKPGDPVSEVGSRQVIGRAVQDVGVEQTDDALARRGASLEGGRTPAPSRNFDGIGATGVTPPDTNGDVGPNHYVQMVNSKFAIYSKAGALLAGPTNINQLWAGAGGRCEATNAGDPIVVYDPLADRWLLSQFAFPAPYAVCVAISQTPDPTGTYYLYEFAMDVFPDYFKFGVWPDAYYMSSNDAAPTGTTIPKVGVFAFDRARMLAGQPATFQKFQVQRNFMLPSDLDGPTPPPAGAPNYFYTLMDDTFWPSKGFPGADRLEVWEYHVDFTTPVSSTFALAHTLPTAPFNYLVCGFFQFSCIQLPAGQKVDALAEYPMWRFAYRNFGVHEAMVGNFTVKASGPNRAGIRWFELRKTGSGGWTIYQEGTHAPDSNQRWMGSIAMDRSGNIALGYSVTGASLFPSIRYATRLFTETLGTLQTETTLIGGGGSQTNGGNRWGDYSAMTVDPTDECTFWYTNEYYASTSQASWSTRVGAFTIPSCGVSQIALAKTVDDANPQPSQRITYTITMSNSSLIDAAGAVISDTLPAGLTFAGPITLSPPGAGTVGLPPTLVSNLAISAGQVLTVTLPVTVNLGLPAGTVITNGIELTGSAIAPVAASAAITVANALPLVGNDTATTPEGTPVAIAVLSNDIDPNHSPLTVVSVSTPAHGTAIISGTNIVYTPDPGFVSLDVFSYTVSDGSSTATATVSVAVTQRKLFVPLIAR